MTEPAPDCAAHLVLSGDSRLAQHATSASPAWLWSADASRILWANPAGATIFGASSPADLFTRRFAASDVAASQVARVAATLRPNGAPRLERLRGFGGGLGRLLTCACTSVTLDDGAAGILIVAAEAMGPTLSLAERARRLLDGATDAVAAFTMDGILLAASGKARELFGRAATLGAIGAEPLAAQALAFGRAAGATGQGAATALRLGRDATTVVILSFAPAAAPTVNAGPTEAAAVPEFSIEPASVIPRAPGDALPQITVPQIAVPQTSAPQTPAPQVFAPQATTQADKPPTAAAPPERADAPVAERRHPLRFVWQMDVDGRFTIGSDEFTEVIGARTATAIGRPWPEVAAELALDPDGRVARAIATRDTWSGITVAWPIDGSADRLLVELSGLPVYDRSRAFRGYRGFGVCRDITRISAVVSARKAQLAAALAGGAASAVAMPIDDAGDEPPTLDFGRGPLGAAAARQNVVPFRNPLTPNELKAPALSPIERIAFRDLARELTSRLKGPGETDTAEIAPAGPAEKPADVAPIPPPTPTAPAASTFTPRAAAPQTENRALLDQLPLGVLVYRLDRLLYANRAFLDWVGYASLDALADAGGLDCLIIDTDGAGDIDEPARPLAISTNSNTSAPVEGRMFQIPWNGDSAMALTVLGTAPAAHDATREIALAAVLKQAEADLREARIALEVASDGVIMTDLDGRIVSANPSAEALFGSTTMELAGRALADLFAPESQRVVLDHVGRLQNEGVTTLRNYGREVVARPRHGGMVPLYMAMGAVANDTSSGASSGTRKICAVFRDITQWKRTEAELIGARRQAETTSLAKSEFLAKIGHDIRTPLNSIIGFAEVMAEGRFGAIENERYVDYLRDIRASGQHISSLVNDLLDLSKIESGKLDLDFASVNLNVAVQHSVALMQPQANRQRIIIRSALSPSLPSVVADARSVRQIVINLLSHSIRYTQAGGQVIVSTALTDKGEVMLRVRDTGVGMNEKDLAIAMEPFRQVMTASHRDGGGLGLPLTKALAEANRANFFVTSKVDDGTLVEIAFPASRVLKD